MTSSTNFKLTNLFTQETICEDKTQTRNQSLMKMFNASITKIMDKCPHCPDYIIILSFLFPTLIIFFIIILNGNSVNV